MNETGGRETRFNRLEAHLFRPVDGASLAAFRVLFGLIMAAGAARYFAYGWLDTLFVHPGYHFKYWGFTWVSEPSPQVLQLLAASLLVSALLMAAGLFYRPAALTTFLSFSYLELLDVTNYLNHHYLAALLTLLLFFLPATRVFSLDEWLRVRRGKKSDGKVPLLSLHLLRYQILIVYFFAGVAKLGSDWLVYGQPLALWINPLSDRPIIGSLLAMPWTPLVLSWVGCLYDLSIGFLLWNSRTRPFAYPVVLIFHSLTRVFFSIGLFPWIMVSSTLIFFSPNWPRRFLYLVQHARFLPSPAPSPKAQENYRSKGQSRRLQRPILLLAAAYAVVQLLLPLRAFAYPSEVLWAEDGMRFSWRVMIREKSASISYEVRSMSSKRKVLVSPLRYINVHQAREMGGQPDMIAQLARHIGRDYEKKWQEPVAVYADTWISFNGRRPARFLDKNVDLMTQIDNLAPASFVLPPPAGPPAQFH